MYKKILTLITLLLIATLALTACGGGNEANNGAENMVENTMNEVTEVENTAVEDTAVEEVPAEAAAKICQVTDTGGIDDKSFNATAWKGVEDAMADFGVEGFYLESQQQTDYEVNISAFVEEDCDLIINVGFLMGDATAAAAATYPDQDFAIIDMAYDPAFENVLGLVYAVDQPSFLAGYIAAMETKTGVVATFGGIQFSAVTDFMDGFVYGVRYYNEVNGTDVKVLGWDPESATGTFVGNFDSLDDGRNTAIAFMDEGADVILPVAGPVGLGSAAAIRERGNAWIIGVDTDWTVSTEYGDIVLTSILKNMNVSVYDSVAAVLDGTFTGGLAVGTLENGGVGVTGDYDLQDIVDGIIAGEIATKP